MHVLGMYLIQCNPSFIQPHLKRKLKSEAMLIYRFIRVCRLPRACRDGHLDRMFTEMKTSRCFPDRCCAGLVI